MDPETSVGLVFIALIASGVLIVLGGMRQRTKELEMAHRERLAMIERGLVPPPELSALPHQESQMRRTARSNKLLSAGILIVGLGLGLAMLIGVASREPEIAVGVGGAVVILGVALIVTALVVHGSRDPVEPGRSAAAPSTPDRRSFPSDPSV